MASDRSRLVGRASRLGIATVSPAVVGECSVGWIIGSELTRFSSVCEAADSDESVCLKDVLGVLGLAGIHCQATIVKAMRPTLANAIHAALPRRRALQHAFVKQSC
jgi:hypothetical protein